jgi:hypothetical protein
MSSIVYPPFSGAVGVASFILALSGHWNFDSMCGVDKCGAAVFHETVSSTVGNLALLMLLTC